MRFVIALRSLWGCLALVTTTAKHVTKLLASDKSTDDEFGWSVAISEDIAVVGAPGDDDNGIDSGSAYVFARNEDGWGQVAKLVANDSGPRFGRSVAISGNIALVGAYTDDEVEEFSVSSVWVFVRSEDGWDLDGRLLPSERAGLYLFGYSVAISGDTALVGVPKDVNRGRMIGTARVFDRNEEGWMEMATLLPDDDMPFQFGSSVAIDGNYCLIGSPATAERTGSAYVFFRNEGGWSQVEKLLADDGAQGDQFGFSVAISGDIALVGAPGDGESKGSVYVFVRNGDRWDQIDKIVPDHREEGNSDRFGWSVDINGDFAIVGACRDDSMSGSAYAFVHDEGGWGQVDKLVARDISELNSFGCSVAIGGDISLVGAYGDENEGVKSGSGYVFNIDITDAHSFQPSNSPSTEPTDSPTPMSPKSRKAKAPKQSKAKGKKF